MAKLNDDLSADFVRSILDYDPETGNLTWKTRPDYSAQWNGRYAGKEAGWTANAHSDLQYKNIEISRRVYKSHRIAWLYMTGEWPADQIDHIDGNGLNNCWDNLRVATHAQNCANTRSQKNNSLGLKGVSFKNGKYRATICMNRKCVHLGYFGTPEEAHAAYCAAANEHRGEYARVA